MSNIKDKVLAILESNKGNYVSGSSLGKTLGVSRSAIWKAIKALKDEGYEISSKTNKGHTLSSDTDVLSIDKISTALKTKMLGKELKYYKSISSTNTILRQMAYEDVNEGLVLLAEQQTSGRGRNKKSFHSPAKNGIYMSFLIRPNIPVNKLNLITYLAAVSVSEAIKNICDINLDIKWVNDLFYKGQKVCGILTEAAIEGESGLVDFIVVGIGININHTEGFPLEFKDKSTALKLHKNEFSQSELVAEILNTFERYYFEYLTHKNDNEILHKYRSRLCVLNRNVIVLKGDNSFEAKVIDFNNDGHLVIERLDGSIEQLYSGEISIKL